MRRDVRIFTFLFTLFAVAMVAAHPLGNFSVNQFSRLEVGKTYIKLHEVLDIAEIPTLQESMAIDTDRDGKLSAAELDAYANGLTSKYAANLQLTQNGAALAVTPVSHEIHLTPGAGDLSTMKITWEMTAQLSAFDGASKISFRNGNYADRTGWNEIVINAAAGVNVFDSSAYGDSITDGLSNYPQQETMAPLGERSAEFSFSMQAIPANARPLKDRDGKPATVVQKDTLAALIKVPEITPAVIFFGLLLALGLGAVHALSPGHGKTVVGAYLVGSRGTAMHAVFLGLTVTVTHTLGVFALGLITLFASNYILPERIMPFLGFISGLLVFFIGATLFKERLFGFMGWKKEALSDHQHDDHDGDEPHTHDGLTHTHGGSTHSHAAPDEITWRSLLALGISGGLLPCPSALVLMLAAIAGGRIVYGLILTVAFSFGLAATLTIVGLIFLNIRNLFGKTSFSESRIFKVLPVFSAFVIAFVGAVLCYTSLA